MQPESAVGRLFEDINYGFVDFINNMTQMTVVFLQDLKSYNVTTLSQKISGYLINKIFDMRKETKLDTKKYLLLRDMTRYAVNFSYAGTLLVIVINKESLYRKNLIHYFRKNLANIFEVEDEFSIFPVLEKFSTKLMKFGHRTFNYYPQTAVQKYSAIIREAGCNIAIMNMFEKEDLNVIGCSPDHLLYYMKEGYLPKIYDPTIRFKTTYDDLVNCIKHVNNAMTIQKAGDAKLNYLLLTCLYLQTRIFKKQQLIYIGSFPLNSIEYPKLLKIAESYKFKVILIDPRYTENELMCSQYLDIFNTSINFKDPEQFTLWFGENNFIIDDAHWQSDKDKLVDIKLRFFNKMRNTVVLKYSPKWHKDNMMPSRYSPIFLPYVKDEIRILIEDTSAIRLTSDKSSKEKLAKQTRILEYYTSAQIKEALSYFLMLGENRIKFTWHDVKTSMVIDGTFSFNGFEISDLKMISSKVRRVKAFLVLTQPHTESRISLKYGDNLHVPIEVEINAKLYALNISTILSLTRQTSLIWDPANNIALTSTMYVSDVSKFDIEFISNHAEAKIISSVLRQLRLDNNWGLTRLYDYVALNAENVSIVNDKIKVDKNYRYRFYQFRKGDILDMSGHLSNYMVLILRFRYPIGVKAWSNMILNWVSRIRRESIFELKDIDMYPTAVGKGFHTQRELMTTLHYMWLAFDGARERKITEDVTDMILELSKDNIY